MGSVTGVSVGRPLNGTVCNEIVAVNVVYIAVPVVVNAVSGDFFGVHPHIVLKVRMGVFDTFIHHGHNNGGVSAGEAVPDGYDIDIGPGKGRGRNGKVSYILIMPLLGQVGVVELAVGHSAFRFRKTVNKPVGNAFADGFILNQLDFRDRGGLQHHLVKDTALWHIRFVPAVQAELFLQGFPSGSGGKSSFEADTVLFFKTGQLFR